MIRLGLLLFLSLPAVADPEPVTIQDGQIQVNPSSGFAKRLKTTRASPGPAESKTLRTVGQMLALANPSGGLSGGRVSWVELDPALSRSAGLRIDALRGSWVGRAFGLAVLPEPYVSQMHPGQAVEVFRYGLRHTSVHGTIFSWRAPSEHPGEVYVVFELKEGQNWYPGTNCEIEFPLLKTRPVQIPVTALIHEGLEEFVVREVSPGHYTPERVTVAGETPELIYVLGRLSPGDTLVSDGAILLKPLVHLALEKKKDTAHASQ